MNRMMWAVLLVKQKHQCQSFQAVTYKQPNLTVNYNLHSARLVLADMELCLSFGHCFSLLSCRLAMRKLAKRPGNVELGSWASKRFLACDGSDLTHFLVGLREADNVLWR